MRILDGGPPRGGFRPRTPRGNPEADPHEPDMRVELDRQRDERDRQRAELDRQRDERERQRAEHDRRQAEHDRRRAKWRRVEEIAYFESLAGRADEPILITDTLGRILFANPASADLLDDPWILDKPVAALVAFAERRRLRGLVDEATRAAEGKPTVARLVTRSRGTGRGGVSFEARIEPLDARKRFLRWTLRGGESGDPASTERMARLGGSIARIVHDLRNPVFAIALTTSALEREIGSGDPASLLEYARDIRTGARRLEELLAGLSTLTRQARPVFEPVEGRRLVHDLQVLFEPLADERGITLAVESDGPVAFHGNAAQIRRVLENLVRNAIEAIGPGPGEVRVSTATIGSNRIRFTVRDDGPGVPADLDPFALFVTTKKDGTGLGLAIAREIAGSHGGTLHFERLDPRGTLFTLELPADPRSRAPA